MASEKPVDVELVESQRDEIVEINSNAAKGSTVPLPKQVPRAQTGYPYLTGPRLWVVLYGLLMSQLLIACESSIVGTSIVSIANDLGSWERAQLVFTMYLVCYASFILVIGELSDIFGRRTSFLASLSIFTIFSIACGASKTMTQLVIFRSFQGLGAGGIQAISIVIIPNLIPLPKVLNYSSAVAMTLILGLIIGLFLGGWISSEGAWRWVFYINGPVGLTTILATCALPWNYPPYTDGPISSVRSLLADLRKVDWLGCGLLVVGSVPLLFALIEAEVLVPWRSASIITCLTVSAIAWLSLFTQQYLLFRKQSNVKPIIPVELFTKKVSAALLVSSFFFGFPYYGIMLTLPKRFTLVNSSSPMRAAIQTLPMVAVVPFVIIAVNVGLGRLASKPKLLGLVAMLVLVACTVIQTLSISVLTKALSSIDFPAGLYVAIAFIGVGNGPYLGVGFGVLSKYAQLATKVNPSDALGALNQARILGGAIGLAVNSRLLVSYVISTQSEYLSGDVRHQLARNPEIVSHIADFAANNEARALLNQGFNNGFIFQAVAAGLAFLALIPALHKRASKRGN
ncbi:major facilitator superfamily domain-containing protein [Dendryphion nanum]|uniref:Major facilitator superfamily domain-containing protein n=1 Tax=Dendryphion nanum TaxID=256645 RepID=A0A9P9CZB5_9PLEO|nr:major facilitator superfamily domain-containing protein [Dendryphion nanum]